MATPKMLTADDIRQGKLTFVRNGSIIHVERRYDFVDISDDIIPEWAGGRIVEDIEYTSLPTNIQDALMVIDNWTYQQALLKEGMD